MKPAETFQAICAAPALETAVRALGGHELARLITWLLAGHGGGVAGLVLGLAQLEAAERFVKAHP